ncbi:MAG: NAD(P)/FAD-dependent oxidoreductase [Candidatus Bipolaricaulia bacterium]
MLTAKRLDVAAAGITGLIASVVFAAAIAAQSADVRFLGLLGVPLEGPGRIVHLGLGLLVGLGFALLVRYTPGGHAAAVSTGILYGLIAWIVGPLTLGTLWQGELPQWSIETATAAFPSMVGHLIYGALTGFGFTLLAALHRRIWPNQADQEAPRTPRSRVVILGGGFGGVGAAQQLSQHFNRDPSVEVTLVSASNHLLFTPMLAEVASSSLDAQHISVPIRAAAPRAVIRHAEAEAIDTDAQTVQIRPVGDASAETLEYDQLVLALGAVPKYFEMSDVERHAFTLKTLADAVELRRHVISTLERADTTTDPAERDRLLRFVVAGGGFAGAETIAELFDLAHSVLRYYPRIDPDELHFVLVHAGDRILPELGEELADYALRTLRERGVDVRLKHRASGADAARVELNDGTEFPTRTLVWTAGNRPNPLLRHVEGEHNDAGAVVCDDTLRVAGTSNVWGVGDCAQIPDPGHPGEVCPPTAQHASRQALTVADNVAAALRGRDDRVEPYAYKSKGMIVVLGHRTAVAEVGNLRFSGLLAWLFWRAVYLSKLPGLEKKVRVFVDWSLDLFFPRDIVLTETRASTQPEPSRTRPAAKAPRVDPTEASAAAENVDISEETP